MIIAGADLSLNKTGLIIADVDQGKFDVILEEHLDSGDGHDVERFWRQAIRIRRLLDHHGVEDVAFEGFSHGSKGNNVLQMAGLGYVTRLALWHRGRGYWNIAPGTLKKLITGSGSTKKELILREVYKRWKFEAADNNTADAYGLARGLAGHHLGHTRKSDAEAWKKAERVEGRLEGWA